MARPKNKTIRPLIESVMKREGCETLQELAELKGIPVSSLNDYADDEKLFPKYETFLEHAERLGVDPAELLRAISKRHRLAESK